MELERFRKAHERDFAQALSEIRRGKKTSHWMWYIFPQLQGLGRSETARYYAINSLEEAVAFLQDDYLGGNLRTITGALLELQTDDAYEVFGSPDHLKLHSSMTLFALACPEETLFRQALEKFYGGKEDGRTRQLLESSLIDRAAGEILTRYAFAFKELAT